MSDFCDVVKDENVDEVNVLKKDLENEEKMSIFEVDEEEKKVFYGEPPIQSYRRGISS